MDALCDHCDGGLYGYVTNYFLDDLMALSDDPNLVEATVFIETPYRPHRLPQSAILRIQGKSESIESGTRVRDWDYGLLQTSTDPLDEPYGVCTCMFC